MRSKTILIDLLKEVSDQTIIGAAIHGALNEGESIGQLVLELQSHYTDNPAAIRSLLGNALTDYITYPFLKQKTTIGYQNAPIVRSKRGRKPKTPTT